MGPCRAWLVGRASLVPTSMYPLAAHPHHVLSQYSCLFETCAKELGLVLSIKQGRYVKPGYQVVHQVVHQEALQTLGGPTDPRRPYSLGPRT